MLKRYLITDPLYYTSDAQTCAQKLRDITQKHRVDYICLRDKHVVDYAVFATEVLAFLPQNLHKNVLLHGDYRLAHRLGVLGVHLPSNALHVVKEAKALGLFVVVSTHTLREAEEAQKNGTDALTFSPIFESPGKGTPVGLEKLKEINDKISLKCFALGGIVKPAHVKACEALGVYGIASIRLFLD